MILNPGKHHLISIAKNASDSELLNLNDLNLKNPKVLVIKIDWKLNFKKDNTIICRKSCQKLSTLSSHMDTDKKAILYKLMIKSQFTYTPLVWKFFFRQ